MFSESYFSRRRSLCPPDAIPSVNRFGAETSGAWRRG